VPEVPVRIVASAGSACRAAAAAARAHGLQVRLVRTRIDGDAARLGVRFAASLARQSEGVVQVRGGESTVSLPAQPGRGGRNQHLALAAALELERRGLHAAYLLAAGTDGIDGSSSDAGALVDVETCQRGRDAGCDPTDSLVRADSGTFLEAAGDLLHTGPTLTNVGDLVLGLRLGGRG
jgi:glycerate 2-kinase